MGVEGTDETALHLVHDFAAPPDQVFDAWGTVDVLRDWWGVGDTWTAGRVEVDLREGGTYRLSMVDAESGAEHTVSGRYLVVERPRHLTFTWAWEADGPPGAGHDETIVRVDLTPTPTGSRLTLTHSRLPAGDPSEMHVIGWQASLERLGRLGLALGTPER